MGDVERGGIFSEIKWRLIGLFGSLAIRLLYLTVRTREVGLENIEAGRGDKGEPVVFAFGHGRLLGNCFNSRGQGACVMVSRHRDGEIIAQINNHLGYTAARGSATRGAVPAIKALLRALGENRDLAITVDGPRGPAGVVKDGVVYTSARTRLPVIATAAGYSACWQLDNWDSFQIPKPFSKMVVVYKPPIQVPEIPELGREAIDPWCEKIGRALKEAAREADLAAAPVHRMDSGGTTSLIEKFLTRVRDRWWHFPLLAVLVPLEIIYRLGWQMREKLFAGGRVSTYRPPVPVVCVGSLCAGGSGKTPLTVHLADRLRARGHNVAVLSRGYGSSAGKDPVIIRPGSANGSALRTIASQAGDEPAMIAHALPEISVVVCADRASAADTAVRHCDADMLVLDDGFGHRRLVRDLDILTFSGRQLAGQSHCFPAGIFREPPRAAGRAAAVAYSGGLLTGFDRPGNPPSLPPWAAEKKLIRLDRRVRGVARLADWWQWSAGDDKLEKIRLALQEKKVIAFCGLADPSPFRDLLAGCSPESLELVAWEDHHRYSAADQELLRSRAAGACAVLVTTEKDAVKLDPEKIGGDVLVVCLELAERDPSVLDSLLDELAAGQGCA